MIKEEILECRKCEIREYYNVAVPYEGNVKAKLMLIGRDPGEEEIQQLRPFCGKAGRQLDDILKDVEIPRSNIYITNVIKCRPFKNSAPHADKYRFCGDLYLKREIALVKPKIIITLGKDAIEYIMGKKVFTTMNSLTREIYYYNNIIVLPAYHPSYLCRLERMEYEKYTKAYASTVQIFRLAKTYI